MNRQPARRSLFHTLLSALAGKASEQAKQHLQPPRRPAPDDQDAWRAYWEKRGQSWRTEPEIDAKRQKELDQHRAIVPESGKGFYPFKGTKLSRADIEWLLATHENGRGPVDWSDESQRERMGLDLRGADLRRVDLSHLPLAGMLGGAADDLAWHPETHEHPLSEAAAVHLEDAELWDTHLEGAFLHYAHLERARLARAGSEAFFRIDASRVRHCGLR